MKLKDVEFLTIRENVNQLKVIQIGVSISNEKGEKP